MISRKYLECSRGQTLVGVMVGLVLSGIVLTITMSIIQEQNKSLKYFSQKTDAVELKQYIIKSFSDGTACGTNFNSKNLVGQVLDITSIDAAGVLNTIHSTLSFSQLNLSSDSATEALVKVGNTVGTSGLKIKSIKYEKIKKIAANKLSGSISISFEEASMPVQLHPIEILQDIFLNETDSENAKTITGCSPPDNQNIYSENIPYPEACELRFGHSDYNNKTHDRMITYKMNQPGFMGLLLSGGVGGDDSFFIGGSCNGDSVKVPDSMEAYIQNCTFDIGLKDKTANEPSVTTNIRPEDGHRISHLMNSESMDRLQLYGTVDKNDTFYFRFACPEPTSLKAKYFKNKCKVCFGYSDEFRPQLDTRVCAPITNKEETDSNKIKWARFRFVGDVNYDDTMFLGFYCGGDSDNDTIYSITKTNSSN